MMENIELRQERTSILIWFRKNDYIINKVILGEWEETDQRFLDYKAERAIKRARLDEINLMLGE